MDIITAYKNFVLSLINTILISSGFAFLQFPSELENLSSGYGGGSELAAVIVLILISFSLLVSTYSILTFRVKATIKAKIVYSLSFVVALAVSLFIAGILWGLSSSAVIGLILLISAIIITPKISLIIANFVLKIKP